jgi:hypothetical protein
MVLGNGSRRRGASIFGAVAVARRHEALSSILDQSPFGHSQAPNVHRLTVPGFAPPEPSCSPRWEMAGEEVGSCCELQREWKAVLPPVPALSARFSRTFVADACVCGGRGIL